MAALSSLLLLLFAHILPFVRSQKFIIQVSVEEEKPIPFKVTNLLVDSGLSKKWPSSTAGALKYEIIQRDGLPENMLRVESNGDLMVVERLDREAVCTGQRLELCELNILVNLDEVGELLEVKMRIIDVNDHAPSFPQPNYKVTINEDAPPGHKFPLPTAKDPDSSNFSVRDYRIVNDEPPGFFTMERNGAELFGVLRQRLDYEATKTLTFILECFDGGLPPQRGSVTVVVQVGDANDHAPKFSMSRYEAQVSESHPLNMRFLQLEASDRDSGSNAALIFSIRSSAPAFIRDTFQLTADGALMLKQSLDYETRKSYLIPVVVKDSALKPLSATAVVEVRVEDQNDNKPRITTHPAKGLTVREGARPNTQIGFVFASDKDKGAAGQLVCSIVASSDFTLETKKEREGLYVFQLSTKRSFDREVEPSVTVTVQCSDRGVPALWSSKKIIVYVLDVNDNPPVFGQRNNKARVKENARPGTVFSRINVHDADSGKNAELSFKLIGTGSDKFAVYSNGTIELRGSLDREAVSRYNFSIIASDHGEPSNTAAASLEINVDDVNDVAPRLKASSRVIRVPEDARVGDRVFHLKAVDPDLALGGNVTFMGVNPFFDVAQDGTITLRNLLDREIKAVLDLNVVLYDHGDPQLRSRETVRVEVTDVNDSPPVFHFPQHSNKTVTISYLDGAKGSLVATVNATDRDKGQNAVLRYKVMEPNGGRVSALSLFTINATSGQIRTAQTLNHFHVDTYNLIVEAADSGVPSISTREDLIIIIDDSPSQNDVQELAAANVTNFVIIIMLCAATIVLSSVLIVAIVHLRRRNRHLDREQALDEEGDYLKVSIASSPVKGSTQTEFGPACEVSRHLHRHTPLPSLPRCL